MASRVKLLNAAAPGTTGLAFKIGTGKQPYSIRVRGGFTFGTGTSTSGVSIETSPDGGTSWDRAFGTIGGENETETLTIELVDLHDKTNAYISYYVQHIRAIFGSLATGTATVYLEMAR